MPQDITSREIEQKLSIKRKKKKTTITRLISSAMAGPSSMIFFFFVETTGKYSERDTNVSEPD